jgi:hypothetical protein
MCGLINSLQRRESDSCELRYGIFSDIYHVELFQTSSQATDINAAGVTKWELISPDIFGGDSKLGGGFLQLRFHLS